MGETAVDKKKLLFMFLLYCLRAKESYYSQGLIHDREEGYERQEGCAHGVCAGLPSNWLGSYLSSLWDPILPKLSPSYDIVFRVASGEDI